VLKDDFRVSYFRGYVEAAERAVLDDGVELTSYAAWSILDNFEWREGYSSRFGIVYTDYATQQRHPKDSARWLSRKFSSSGKGKKTASRAEIEEMRRERKKLLAEEEEERSVA
jgi:beta-glucosidase/6-phospho-beta-glucosidase/beta-galactosidase